MEEKWDELQLTERRLAEREYEIEQSESQIDKLKDSFEQQFREARHLLLSIKEEHAQTIFGAQCEDSIEIFNQELYRSIDNLEQEETVLKKEKRQVQDDIDDIYYEKRRLATEKETKE